MKEEKLETSPLSLIMSTQSSRRPLAPETPNLTLQHDTAENHTLEEPASLLESGFLMWFESHPHDIRLPKIRRPASFRVDVVYCSWEAPAQQGAVGALLAELSQRCLDWSRIRSPPAAPSAEQVPFVEMISCSAPPAGHCPRGRGSTTTNCYQIDELIIHQQINQSNNNLRCMIAPLYLIKSSDPKSHCHTAPLRISLHKSSLLK